MQPSLASGEVHVWWFELDRAAHELTRLADVLAADERDRVARFRFQQDADRALAARGLLRRLLSRYVGCPPGQLRFEYGPQSKPYLPGLPLHFNLSHSQGLGVCAIALDQPVGVDVEYERTEVDLAGVAEFSFSEAERLALATASGPEAVRGFFRCWTLKEAYIKARGGGLSIPLDGFDVPLVSTLTDSPQAVVSREAASDAHGWFVRELRADAGYAAALAARLPTLTLREWRLDEA